MNLKNKSDKELWDMLYEIRGRMIQNKIDGIDDNECEAKYRYDIHKEIIRRENREECTICHGKGYTTDHHDPCTECGGSGYYD